jgi:hypothetical protein
MHGQEGEGEASGIAALPPAFVRSGQEQQVMATALQGKSQMKGLLGTSATRAMPVYLDDA